MPNKKPIVAPNRKPHVAVACICEKALREKDDVISLIRIVDKFHISSMPKMPERKKSGVPLTVVVSLKSGSLVGKFQLGLRVRTPAGEVKELHEPWPVVLKGDEHGANLILDFTLGLSELGLFWIDVLWDNELLTSMPFRLTTEALQKLGKEDRKSSR